MAKENWLKSKLIVEIIGMSYFCQLPETGAQAAILTAAVLKHLDKDALQNQGVRERWK